MKPILPILLSAALLLSGCAAPGGTVASQGTVNGTGSTENGAEPARVSYVLSQAVYPEFPQQPVMPLEGGSKEWEDYYEAYDKYLDTMLAIRGGEYSLTEGEQSALASFAARSTPLALDGHEGENAVYSPLSLWSALAMLAQCADGTSRQQVLDALETDSVDTLQETVSHVWRMLYTDDGMSSLILGSSIWLNDAVQGTYVPETLETLAEKYFASTYSVPMGSAEADQAITEWVKEQTNGLIGGKSPVVQTKVDTLALLASSLYFRAGWTSEFRPEQTEEDVFTDAAGQERRVDFMHRTQDSSAFLRREGYQAAQLSTELGGMIFVLPDEGVAPESLLHDPEFLSGLDFSAQDAIWGKVQWSVPKFDVDSDLELLDTLAALGIVDLLDDSKADLSALTDLPAVLSNAKQMARVKVDEEGVEAAAVTILMYGAASMPDPDPELCVMNLNRPFLFVIRTQGVPLFVGVVNHTDP